MHTLTCEAAFLVIGRVAAPCDRIDADRLLISNQRKTIGDARYAWIGQGRIETLLFSRSSKLYSLM